MEQLKNESSRQYEYMEEMKKWVQKKSGELGRKLTCHVTTFGCQMNEKDSEKLLGILETIGYEEVETEEADFHVQFARMPIQSYMDIWGRLRR